MEFTGKELNYLHVCRRKLWLFRHGIRPEMESDLVQLGMLLDEVSFPRQSKEIPIGEVGVLDWADFKDGVIHETKMGKTPGGGDEAQVRYYLAWLNQHGVRAHEAVIHYPRRRATTTVTWEGDAEQLVRQDLVECERVVTGPIPNAVRRPYCKRCAYEEICFV